MIVKQENRNGALVLRLIGELDHHSADSVRDAADAAIAGDNVRQVVFDLTYMSFMDSAGIGVLLGRYKQLARRRIPVYIAHPADVVDRILRMSGVYKVIKRI